MMFAAMCVTSTAAAASPPDPAFLEFLGEFTTAEGDWVDPLDLALVEGKTLEASGGQEETSDDGNDGNE
jgi:hypothetical protein